MTACGECLRSGAFIMDTSLSSARLWQFCLFLTRPDKRRAFSKCKLKLAASAACYGGFGGLRVSQRPLICLYPLLPGLWSSVGLGGGSGVAEKPTF